ncbi:MAG: DUF3348 family protein [Hahellaceae bacterium]|nr:DUF3348 family protein [Hahellaceae bacterium]MCP5170147.1 DUF3348 family protein [Hahellaceae bacterium]
MNQTSSSLALNGSRLVRFLSDLNVSDVAVSHKHFIEKLGRFINITDSITLAHVLSRPVARAFEPDETAGETLKQTFVQARSAMVQTIAESFASAEGGARIRLPMLSVEKLADAKTAYEPYHRFYAAHQREFEQKVAGLHTRIRDQAAGLSPQLAQLAELDRVLGNTLSGNFRKFYAVTPRLLGKRFECLLGDYLPTAPSGDGYAEWIQPGGWLARFFREMNGVLLAELEVRLLPVLGLLEAVDEQFPGSVQAMTAE